MKKLVFILLGLLILSSTVFGFWRMQFRESKHQIIEAENIREEYSHVVEFAVENRRSDRTISITDGVKHSVPLSKIRGGGPAKDGIPSIDDPKFVSVEESNEYLDDSGLGIAISVNGTHRFYPNQILVWHEIVNDQIGDMPVVITYCPLCATGVVYDPVVDGEALEFGTSGKLWNSNLVMYDRTTDTYWSQVLGEAIVGELTGVKLDLLPYENISWEDWKLMYPDGEVLSKKTGHFRNYNRDPYGGYYGNSALYFPVDNEDDRYHRKEITYGVEIDGEYKAYPIEELEKGHEEFRDMLAGVGLRIEYDKITQVAKFFNSETGEEIVPVYGFWFSWISVHPETDIYVFEK